MLTNDLDNNNLDNLSQSSLLPSSALVDPVNINVEIHFFADYVSRFLKLVTWLAS